MFYSSLAIIAALIVLFIVTCLIRWVLATRSLTEEAQAEFKTRQGEKPGTIKDVSEAEFTKLYVDSFRPRWTLYAAGGAAMALLISPVSMLVVPAIYDIFWRASGAPPWGDRTGYVYMFSLFFGLCFVWAVVAASAARLMHQRRPEPFHHALARARGEPIPEDTGWRPRPKWARKVRPTPSTDGTKQDTQHADTKAS